VTDWTVILTTVGATIPLGRDKGLRVTEIRPEASDENPVLVVAGSPSMNEQCTALKRSPQRRTLERGLANCG
jgi:hypothetical protein